LHGTPDACGALAGDCGGEARLVRPPGFWSIVLGKDRGAFITLEGIDGTGKTTQARLLAERLEGAGFSVTSVREPGGTRAGDAIREVLLDAARGALTLSAELFLYMASRAQLVAEVIRPALDEGRIVISDRFLMSSVAYQGEGGGLGRDLVRQVGLVATGGLAPEMTIVLDMPVESALARVAGGRDRIESRPASYHERVRAGFLAEAGRDPERVRVIDATGTVDEVAEAVWKAVKRVLQLDSRP